MILNSARISRPTLLITPVSLFHCSARLIPIAENIPNSAVKSLISEYGEHENTYGKIPMGWQISASMTRTTASRLPPVSVTHVLI
jgi:hypothetical protein